jgi:hypothetical protein
MEPLRQTSPALLGVHQQLAAREPIFHRPEFGITRADFEAMMAEDFWETGASGERYSKAHVLGVLEERQVAGQKDEWETGDFYCQEIAPDHYLLTYTLLQGSRKTRRATLWRNTPGGWKIIYHQGTVVTPPG